MNEEISMSPATLVRLTAELEELTTTGRDAMADRLQRARALGDLKENAEYHAAKDAQGLMEARIRQLSHLVKSANVREASTTADEVGPGVIVTVKDGDDEDDYLIAASAEEKLPGVRTVTPASPMGTALWGKKIGDKADISAPGGKFTVEITGLRPS